jgi:hypothetical protein
VVEIEGKTGAEAELRTESPTKEIEEKQRRGCFGEESGETEGVVDVVPTGTRRDEERELRVEPGTLKRLKVVLGLRLSVAILSSVCA